MLKKTGLTLDLTARILIHGLALYLAFTAVGLSKAKEAPQRFLDSLWSGLDLAYLLPGSQFKIFKPHLQKKDRVSLIFDRPITATTKDKENARDVQNYLAPVIINLETVESRALVYCSSQAIADRRLNETGYEWIELISPGKGIAGKKT